MISSCQVDEWKEERKNNYENGRKRGRWEGSECESECNEEERNLIRRRDVLIGQLGEARWLKQNIEKRSKKVRLKSVYLDIFANQSFCIWKW